jgi:MFS family permease
MSIYFLAMYLLGGALGPFVVGAISDYFTKQGRERLGSFGIFDSCIGAISSRRPSLGDVRRAGFECVACVGTIYGLADC